MSAFHQGAHCYLGCRNSRAQRLYSKIRHGIAPIRAEVWREVFSGNAGKLKAETLKREGTRRG